MNYKLISPVNQNITELEQIMLNRGVPREQIEPLLNAQFKDIESPYNLDNIEEAAKCLLTSICHREKIYVQVDSDCDGYTSAAILINYLHSIFPATIEETVIYNLHNSKHHGINIDAIPNDVKLVVTPDSSSNESEIHAELADRGIRTIVLDHHHTDYDINETAIIVNNQLSKDYTNKALSGAGIVYQFCRVLDEIIGVDYAKNFLDLAAVGNCADLMDTRAIETRAIMNCGFDDIQNVFLQRLIEKQSYKMEGEVTPFTVGWYIAPLINAMTRSGTYEEKVLLFDAMLDYLASKSITSTKRGHKGEEESLVDQAIRVCGSVKTRQEKSKKEALDMIIPTLDPEDTHPIIIVKLENPVDTNLTGLLANTIMGLYRKPVLILNKTETGWSGSGRGTASQAITDFRDFIDRTGFAEYAEGHAEAFGVSFTDYGLKTFENYMFAEFGTSNTTTCYPVDFEWYLNDDFDRKVINIAQLKGIWGRNLDEPYVALKNIPVRKTDIQLLGKGTLKITIKNHDTTCIMFNAQNLYDTLMSYFVYDDSVLSLSILGMCAINNYMGIQPQIKIEDIEVSAISMWDF